MWTDYIKDNLWVLIENLFIMENEIKVNPNSLVFEEAKKDLFFVLKKLNDHLNFLTFLVGSSMSLADLFLAASLKDIYKYILNNEDKKTFNNLTRWFRLNSNSQEFISIFGSIEI